MNSRRNGAIPILVVLASMLVAFVPISFVAGGDGDSDLVQTFVRGDVDLDERAGLTDVLDCLHYLFLAQDPEIDCDKAYDFNDSGDLGIADPIYLLTYNFLDGDEPAIPFQGCGTDPTADSLTCEEYKGCDVVRSTDGSAAAHLLRRITYGQTPALFDRVLEIGVQNYIHEQLNPDDIEDGDNDHFNDLLDEIRPDELISHLARLQVRRGLYSNRQLQEVLTDFWENHFNTDFRTVFMYFARFYDNETARLIASKFEYLENESLRENALGKFEDLIVNSATSPTMLVYLDNQSNVSGNPNENYARELLELHTLGVDNGYTQEDIEALARVFTGWRICLLDIDDVDDPDAECFSFRGRDSLPPDDYVWAFHFDEDLHDQNEKTLFSETAYEIVLGDDEEGVEEGFEFIEHVAVLSQTAEYVCTKLVQKFVNDDPPADLIADCLDVWLDTDGDLKAVVETILLSEEFFVPEHRLDKVKTPLEYVLSTVRAYGGELSLRSNQIIRFLELAPQILFQFKTPDGFPESGEDQIGTQQLRNRMSFNEILYTRNDIAFPDIVDIMEDRDVDLDDAESVVTFWLDRLFPGRYGETDLELAVDFLETDDDGDDLELDSDADNYNLRIRKLLAFISAFPQHLEQ